MAIVSPNSSTATPVSAPSTEQNYGAALATVTTLFFMWGFLTCLNDILVPHLKSIFDLNYTKVMLIQFAFFGAYFIFSIPSAKIIDWMVIHAGRYPLFAIRSGVLLNAFFSETVHWIGKF